MSDNQHDWRDVHLDYGYKSHGTDPKMNSLGCLIGFILFVIVGIAVTFLLGRLG